MSLIVVFHAKVNHSIKIILIDSHWMRISIVQIFFLLHYQSRFVYFFLSVFMFSLRVSILSTNEFEFYKQWNDLRFFEKICYLSMFSWFVCVFINGLFSVSTQIKASKSNEFLLVRSYWKSWALKNRTKNVLRLKIRQVDWNRWIAKLERFFLESIRKFYRH